MEIEFNNITVKSYNDNNNITGNFFMVMMKNKEIMMT